MLMAFQKRALTPEEIEKTEGGYFNNLMSVYVPNVKGTFWRSAENPGQQHLVHDRNSPIFDKDGGILYPYIVYNNDTNEPIAVAHTANVADELDWRWNRCGKVQYDKFGYGPTAYSGFDYTFLTDEQKEKIKSCKTSQMSL